MAQTGSMGFCTSAKPGVSHKGCFVIFSSSDYHFFFFASDGAVRRSYELRVSACVPREKGGVRQPTIGARYKERRGAVF